MKFWSKFPKHLKFAAIVIVTAGIIVGAGLKSQTAFSGLEVQSAPSPSSSPVFPVQAVQAPLPKQSPTPIAPKPTLPPKSSPSSIASPPITLQPKAVSSKVASSYGHLPYVEDDPARLQLVGQYVRENYSRRESLDLEAVQAFHAMATAAKAAGVSLMPISGFRSIADQAALFARQIERKGSKEAAAKWSAPPGYSEHHTGYAIDIADQQHPDTDLKLSFDTTPAYQWLAANAQTYGFELSFPPNNLQGVSYEPWHWRYVTSARAGQVFALAKNLEP